MSETPKFRPAEVFHPAEYIRDELLARGWSLDTFTAHALPAPRSVDDAEWIEAWGLERLGWELYMGVAGAVDGLRMGEHGAAALERAFGIDAEMWLAHERLWLAASPEQRSPPPDNEDLMSDEIQTNLAAFNDRTGFLTMSDSATVWVCVDATDYEGFSIEAIYADVHGARWWLNRERTRLIKERRKHEREYAKIEGRKPDYSGCIPPAIYADPDREGFSTGGGEREIRKMEVSV